MLTRTGSAHRKSLLYRALRGLGVLDQHPYHAKDRELVAQLPWGGRRLDCDSPEPRASFDGMWPQASVVHPELPPAIATVKSSERRHHLRINATRYLGQILALSPKAACKALFKTRVKPISDQRFSQIISHTCLAQHLRPGTHADLQVPNEQNLFHIPMTMMEEVEPLEGMYLPNTSVWMIQTKPREYEVLAIEVGGIFYWPKDLQWPWARYVALMCLQHYLICLTHPKLHFPNDIINCLTRSMIPEGHLLYRLLKPFTQYTLGLDQAVLHHQRSVFYNSQKEVYTPFSTAFPDQLAAIGYRGYEPADLAPFHYTQETSVDTHYQAYLDDWLSHIQVLTTTVTERMADKDPYVSLWADEVARWVPGFPDGQTIWKPGQLAIVAARYIMEVTVRHSADHHSYASIPIEEAPMRIRVSQDKAVNIKPQDLITREDYFRAQLARAMFFEPVIYQSLDQVRFSFTDPQLRQAGKAFVAEMAELDQRWKNTNFPQATQIASSIQY